MPAARVRILVPFLVLSLPAACGGRLPPSQDSEMIQDTLSFLALGDSYTIGEGIDSDLRWPVQLVRRLRTEGVTIRDPLIIARTGWTTDELAAEIDEAEPEGPFDLVTLLIGVNNQYRGRNAAEYRVQFSGLLARAVDLAGGNEARVLVLSIPDWGVMPFAEGRDRGAITREINAFNAVNREESLRLGAHYVDVTRIGREFGSDPGQVADDGLHPSGTQYAKWVDAVLPVARKILGVSGG